MTRGHTLGEGWGLPVAEAMAMGLPVLVTNFSGPAHFVRDDDDSDVAAADDGDDDDAADGGDAGDDAPSRAGSQRPSHEGAHRRKTRKKASSNGYLVSIDGVDAAGQARPSARSLAAAMRRVATRGGRRVTHTDDSDDGDDALARGRRARASMLSRWSPANVSSVIMRQLGELVCDLG